jgi:hypothetical protein
MRYSCHMRLSTLLGARFRCLASRAVPVVILTTFGAFSFDCNRTRGGADQEVPTSLSRPRAEQVPLRKATGNAGQKATESKLANACLVGPEAFPGEANWVTSDVLLPSPCIPDDMFVESEITKHGGSEPQKIERW